MNGAPKYRAGLELRDVRRSDMNSAVRIARVARVPSAALLRCELSEAWEPHFVAIGEGLGYDAQDGVDHSAALSLRKFTSLS